MTTNRMRRTSMSSPQRGESAIERRAMKLPRERKGHEKLLHPWKDGFKQTSHRRPTSGCASCMQELSVLKGGTLIDFAPVPHGKEDAYPDVCQSTNSHAVTLALGTFALIIRLGPRLVLCAQPGKLVQGIAQGFQ